MAASEVIGRALEIIEEFGWVQNRYGNESDGYCISGAIYKAVCEREAEEMTLSEFFFEDGAPWQLPMRTALLPIQEHTGPNVALWNDHPERTLSQVTEVLRRVAYESGVELVAA